MKIWCVCTLLAVTLVGPPTEAGYVNHCDEPTDFPDVIVSDLFEVARWGTVGEITAFSVGTTSCNVGTCELQWQAQTNQHPVIAQNMYRLIDGRFEQIGQSWLKHGFFALSTSFCSNSCEPTDGETLGVNCADPYSAGLNGLQTELGPKSEVNVATGRFPFPPLAGAHSGDTVFRRLQVQNMDLDPARNPNALYFVEGQYVTPDDAAARRRTNNASWAPITLQGAEDPRIGETRPTEPAIHAWQVHQRDVQIGTIDVAADGRFLVGARVSRLGNGLWHYEYAVQNLSSHNSARSFRVPLPAGAQVVNVGFHDVDYHSGEPYDGTDWQATIKDGAIVWSTAGYEQNRNANALRWGTLYNFRFDSDVAPAQGPVNLELFRPPAVRPAPKSGYHPYSVRTLVPKP